MLTCVKCTKGLFSPSQLIRNIKQKGAILYLHYHTDTGQERIKQLKDFASETKKYIDKPQNKENP